MGDGYLGAPVIGFAYGIALHNLALIIPNTTAFITGAATIAVARHHRTWAPPLGAMQMEPRRRKHRPPVAHPVTCPGDCRR